MSECKCDSQIGLLTHLCVSCKLLFCQNCYSAHQEHEVKEYSIPESNIAPNLKFLLQILDTIHLKISSRTFKDMQILLSLWEVIYEQIAILSNCKSRKEYSQSVVTILNVSHLFSRSLDYDSIEFQKGWEIELLKKIENYTSLVQKISKLTEPEPVDFIHFWPEYKDKIYLYNVKTKEINELCINEPIGMKFDTIQIKNIIYIVGGKQHGNVLNTMYALNIIDSKYEQKCDLLEPRENPTLIGVNDIYVLCIGGHNPEQGHMITCEIYTIAQNIWKPFPKLLYNLDWVAACIFNNKDIYTFGGCDGSGSFDKIQHIDLCDISSGWEIIKMPLSIADSGVVQISNRSIIIIGGSQYSKKNIIQTFNPYKKQLKIKSQFGQAIHFRQRKVLISKGRIYGFTYSNNLFASDIFGDFEKSEIIKFEQ